MRQGAQPWLARAIPLLGWIMKAPDSAVSCEKCDGEDRLDASVPRQCDDDPSKSQGLAVPNTTHVPDEFLDHWMHRLRGAEIKVFLYISRRTLGFKKRVDAIGMDQLMNGIRTRKGRRLDHGTGLSESGVKKAVRALIDKGLIRRVRQKDPQRPSQDIQSLYALRFRDKEGGHKGAPGGGTGVPRVGTQEKPTGGHHRVPTIDSSRNSSTDSSPSSSPDGDGTSPKPTDDWVADFETFWSFYPRDRGSKDEARRAYRSKLRDDPQGRQEALEGLRRSLMSKQWVDSWCDRESPGHYIPHAATFIRNRRWDLQPAPHPKVYSVQAALDLYDVPKGRGASAKQTDLAP